MTRAMVALTVEELNEYVRRSLASDSILRSLCLRGEISNFKRHISGHWYFTLKDSASAINCAMFRSSAVAVAFAPKDGQQVRLYGSVGLYTKTGQYQFYATNMESDGIGALHEQFEALKKKLANEGLFDSSLKKPLPLLPKGVGIVTSKTGAVVHDIARVTWRRNPAVNLYLYPSAVQGVGAAQEIANGIGLLDALDSVDVIIIGRGGGSMEDLWAFNEEPVARAIANCTKPVVSAVGHETDVTIADFIADVRAATPSAAAEIVVPKAESLHTLLEQIFERMQRAVTGKIDNQQWRVASLANRLNQQNPDRRLQTILSKVEQITQRLDSQANAWLMQKIHEVKQCAFRLRAAGPHETLARGYAIILHNDYPVMSISELNVGKEVDLRFLDGQANAIITCIDKGES